MIHGVGGWDGLKNNAFGTFEKGGRSEFHRKRKETIGVYSIFIVILMLDGLKPSSTSGSILYIPGIIEYRYGKYIIAFSSGKISLKVT